jgi:hypothetical protein
VSIFAPNDVDVIIVSESSDGQSLFENLRKYVSVIAVSQKRRDKSEKLLTRKDTGSAGLLRKATSTATSARGDFGETFVLPAVAHRSEWSLAHSAISGFPRCHIKTSLPHLCLIYVRYTPVKGLLMRCLLMRRLPMRCLPHEAPGSGSGERLRVRLRLKDNFRRICAQNPSIIAAFLLFDNYYGSSLYV